MYVTERGKDEAISLSQAIHEAAGRISYQQLWKAIRRGQIVAFQPHGKHGHYRVRRGDLEQLLKPVIPQERN